MDKFERRAGVHELDCDLGAELPADAGSSGGLSGWKNFYIGDGSSPEDVQCVAGELEAEAQTDITFEQHSWPCLVVVTADDAVCNGLAMLAQQRVAEHELCLHRVSAILHADDEDSRCAGIFDVPFDGVEEPASFDSVAMDSAIGSAKDKLRVMEACMRDFVASGPSTSATPSLAGTVDSDTAESASLSTGSWVSPNTGSATFEVGSSRQHSVALWPHVGSNTPAWFGLMPAPAQRLILDLCANGCPPDVVEAVIDSVGDVRGVLDQLLREHKAIRHKDALLELYRLLEW